MDYVRNLLSFICYGGTRPLLVYASRSGAIVFLFFVFVFTESFCFAYKSPVNAGPFCGVNAQNE